MTLTTVAELVRRETGIAIAEGGHQALRSALRRAAPELAPDAFVRAVSDPVRGRGLLDRLIDEVTVQESSFVRDRGQLDGIRWHDLLQGAHAAGAPAIRVWSVGCATGEEPYTLALLAAEEFTPGPPPVDVLGTDISSAALAAAAAGRYRERAVRGLDRRVRGRYLAHQDDGSYLVGDELRKLVRFQRHNLVRDPAPPRGEARFDLITCRNVLIYFERAAAERMAEQLNSALRPGGVLLLGAADTLQRTVRIHPVDGAAASPAAFDKPGARQPLGRRPPPGDRLAAALAAAGRGDRANALSQLVPLLAANPLDADAQFACGLVFLEEGSPGEAVARFRGALYADPGFALAAFTLGCAYDALGQGAAARRAYEQALRTIDPDDDRHEVLLQQVDIGDIAAACRARLQWHQRPGDRDA
jgi:chemotaxis protein methyltransferase CheR